MYIYDKAADLAMMVEIAVNQALEKTETSDEYDKRVGYDPVTHTTAKQRAEADEDGICMNVIGEYVCLRNRGDNI